MSDTKTCEQCDSTIGRVEAYAYWGSSGKTVRYSHPTRENCRDALKDERDQLRARVRELESQVEQLERKLQESHEVDRERHRAHGTKD
jgi:uncharacterized protein YlxW (UPF0749 family)